MIFSETLEQFAMIAIHILLNADIAELNDWIHCAKIVSLVGY